jgi:hypothetical protein
LYCIFDCFVHISLSALTHHLRGGGLRTVPFVQILR